ncbi:MULTISPECIES: DegQ family serine endoprotease [Thalassospira]|uniref:Probable periplasmic serine endoprotease DegP-like n=1 Tax=Thalassospira povalilytica TaxID=732237 RepID=A0A8I1M788_9PROT|nr:MULTISPECIES: DegQ family serine endoprotease [Thalassospira]MEE3046966.1 DegQ family serine endoprotease [Pseudomonadota bacterium]KZB60023.1 serine protease [Thalassospira sp. MCCC 1A02491]MAL42114.1 serine protease [Thalassospira sp.]MBN8196289.1 DegQ family serine endoprotease [Thalassospira povalilytica]MBO6772656.1 DegQ family serine endoprotease [Thalassospira sp.]|tara:strand:+ start:2200 stop:3693 length:1494 start_codon:yes stop_codon:yes gene_type:complete
MLKAFYNPVRSKVSAALVIVLLGVTSVSHIANARPAPESFADLAEKLLPSVVNISTSQMVAERQGPDFQFPPGSPFEDLFRDFMDRNGQGGQGGQAPQKRRATALGSGFIISADGYIVTNNHVIDGADEISVRLHDGETLDAELIGRDPKTDVALLKVEPKDDLPFVKWGDSDASRIGDWAMAIGNPFGLGGTVTAGIISARNRDINQGPYDDFIQTDASINRGNSGGPLFNLDGDVIGINSAIYSPSGGSVGIGFAIPSAIAQGVVDQLKEYGRTRRGWLGVHIQTVTDDIADSVGLDSATGAMVAGVSDDSPAKKAGIKQGDVILKFDGKDVESMRRLPRIVAETKIGKDVDVVIWRDGKKQTVQVELGELEEEVIAASASPSEGDEAPAIAEASIAELGIKVANVDDALRQRYNLAEGTEGVIVTDVSGDSYAAEKGVRPGDIIIEASHSSVTTVEDVTKAVKAAVDDDKRTILMLIETSAGPRYFGLTLSVAE